MRKIVISVLACLVIILVFVILIFLNYDLQNALQEYEKLPDSYVATVIDGDTIKLASGDIVRLLCIDAPEKGKEGYEEARDFLESLILNKEVILESDIEDKDKYNRLLRYVYLNTSEEMIFVNKEIYLAGYGEMLVIPPSDSKCDVISFSS